MRDRAPGVSHLEPDQGLRHSGRDEFQPGNAFAFASRDQRAARRAVIGAVVSIEPRAVVHSGARLAKLQAAVAREEQRYGIACDGVEGAPWGAGQDRRRQEKEQAESEQADAVHGEEWLVLRCYRFGGKKSHLVAHQTRPAPEPPHSVRHVGPQADGAAVQTPDETHEVTTEGGPPETRTDPGQRLRGDPRFEALLSDPKNNAPLF